MRTIKLRVLAGGGMAGEWTLLKPTFEAASGHSLDIFFGTTPNLIKEATSGKPFDLAVVPSEFMRDAGARARVTADPTIDIARVGLGVAVRAGAAKPEIGSAEAFKAALLAAQSIATVTASAAGALVMNAIERVGITDSIKSKLQAKAAPGEIIEAVVKGEAELGLFLLNVLTTPGLDVVGPFPPALQQQIVYTAAIASGARETEAARTLIAWLKSAEATAIIKAKGMTPC